MQSAVLQPGPMKRPVRMSQEWRPEPMLCKRFNVPDPFKGRAAPAKSATQFKSDELSLPDTAAAAAAGFLLPGPPPMEAPLQLPGPPPRTPVCCQLAPQLALHRAEGILLDLLYRLPEQLPLRHAALPNGLQVSRGVILNACHGQTRSKAVHVNV